MNTTLHLIIVTPLSMMMTLFLHCTLNDTSASGLLLQDTVADRIIDVLLYARCLLNNGTGMCITGTSDKKCFLLDVALDTESCGYVLGFDNIGETCFAGALIVISSVSMLWFDESKSMYYCAPAFNTIINAWCLARFWYVFDVVYPVDVFSVYFLLWQCMFIKLKWDYEELPAFSIVLYRVSICWLVASASFFIQDSILRYLPKLVTLAFFWTESVTDM